MNYTNSNPHINALYDYAAGFGISSDTFFGLHNLEKYLDTAVNAYTDYALFKYSFKNRIKPGILRGMFDIDLRSRLGNLAGIASGSAYESLMLLEPPGNPQVGMENYFRAARPADYRLLFCPVVYRQDRFERFAYSRRKPYLDDKTWYLYIFVTEPAFQGQGYGKKLLKILLGFADEHGYSICLETNEKKNVGIYEHFGFRTVDSLLYQDSLEHYVMLYGRV